MLQRGFLGGVALLGLLAGAVAEADDRRYSSQPQVRLGIDVLWGGYGGPVYAAPPVIVYPPHYASPRHAWDRGYERGYDRGYDRGYGGAKWKGKGRGHHKHDHHSHRGHDWDHRH